jgi:hypothetical protein
LHKKAIDLSRELCELNLKLEEKMALINAKRAVGIFSNYQNAEVALTELQASGFPMDKVSVVAPDVSRRNWLPGIDVRDRFDSTRYEFLKERASLYQERLSRGYYLVMVEGTEEEIRRAESILSPRGIQDWGIYDGDRLADDPRNVAGVGKQRRAVGVFRNRRDAEQALHELRDSGFPMNRVSVIVKDADRDDEMAGAQVRDRVGNKADEGATVGALSGGVLGGLTGLFVGLGTLAIPGIGPIMLAGAAATTIATTLAGGAIGAVAGTLLGALIGLGIPEERARVYNERVARGEYLVIVDGTDEEIARSEAILSHRGIEEYGVYDAPHTVTVPPTPETATSSGVPAAGFGRNKYAVGFFPRLGDAELAIDDLRDAGFPLGQISLVAQHFDRQEPFTGIDLRDRFDAMRIGLSDERARFYNDRLTRGDYLVIVNGMEDEIRLAAAILSNRGIHEWQVYDPTAIDSTLPSATTAANPTVTGMGLGSHKGAVGFFPNRRDAELAIGDLRNAGFPLGQISLIARHFEPQGPFLGLDLRDRLDARRMGLPDERVQFYNDRITRGDYVVVVRGTDDEIRRAASILSIRGIQEFGVYDAPELARDGHDPVVDRYDTPEFAAAPAAYPTATPTARVPNRASGNQQRAIGVFPYRRDAEAAITELRDSGFPMSQVSVIAQDADRNDPIAGAGMNPHVGNKADEGAKAGAATGGALGGLGGLLVGLGTLAIPGVGPVILGGAAATAIATAISGGAIGAAAGGLVGALAGLGIPEEQARVYNDRLARGYYLLMVNGTEDEIRRAEAILRHHSIQDFDIYDVSDADTTRGGFSRVERDDTPGVYPQPGSHPNVTIIDRRDETL